MKALVYQGPREVTVEEVPDARIERPTDVLVRVTSTNICGSDLHMYEGRTTLETGRVLGHENLGVVVEVGSGVDRVKTGDRVCLPFNVACGFCENCEAERTGFCLTVDSDTPGGAYGFAEMGTYAGGQAEFLRVPWGDFNCLVLPEDAQEKENDYVMLSDIFPTGYHATELAGVSPGESVVVYGAGPVGLMAAYSAALRGAGQVWSSTTTRTVSRWPRRPGRSPSTTPRATTSSRSWSGPAAAPTRVRVRRLPGARRRREREAGVDHERPGRLGAGDRRHRRGRGLPAAGRRSAHRADP